MSQQISQDTLDQNFQNQVIIEENHSQQISVTSNQSQLTDPSLKNSYQQDNLPNNKNNQENTILLDQPQIDTQHVLQNQPEINSDSQHVQQNQPEINLENCQLQNNLQNGHIEIQESEIQNLSDLDVKQKKIKLENEDDIKVLVSIEKNQKKERKIQKKKKIIKEQDKNQEQKIKEEKKQKKIKKLDQENQGETVVKKRQKKIKDTNQQQTIDQFIIRNNSQENKDQKNNAKIEKSQIKKEKTLKKQIKKQKKPNLQEVTDQNQKTVKKIQRPKQQKKEKKLENLLCTICNKDNTDLKCKSCKIRFHLKCLPNQEQDKFKKQRLCKICKDKKNLQRKLKRQIKRENNKQNVISTPKKETQNQQTSSVQKQRNSEKKINPLVEFKKQYPEYISIQNKIQFPIQDELLVQYQKIFPENKFQKNIEIEDRIKYHAFIPKEILFDILQLWNFFESFYDEIDGPDFSKEELYAALSYNKDNQNIQLINDIHLALIKLFVENFKQQDGEYEGFLGLIQTYDNISLILNNIWLEYFLQMKEFVSEVFEQNKSIIDIMQNIDLKNYNFLDIKIKIQILKVLIESCYQLDIIKKHISSKIEDTVSFQKIKIDSQNELKIEEQSLNDAQKLLEELQQKYQENEFKQSRQKNKETQDQLQKVSLDIYKLNLKIDKLKNKIQINNFKCQFTLNQTQMLGEDINRNSYWFIKNDIGIIYVNNNDNWGYLELKANLSDLMKNLNQKGLREKKLYDTLNTYQQSQFFDLEKNVCIPNDYDKILNDVFKYNLETTQKNTRQIESYKQKIFQFLDPKQIINDVQEILQIIIQMEKQFTKFLQNRQQFWQREILMNQIDQIQTIQQLSEFLSKIVDGISHVLYYEEDDEKNQMLKKTHLKLWGLPNDSYKQQWEGFIQNVTSIQGVIFALFYFLQILEKYINKKQVIKQKCQYNEKKIREKPKKIYDSSESQNDNDKSYDQDSYDIILPQRQTRRTKILD